MSNRVSRQQRGLDSPALHHVAITPSDTLDLAVRPRVIYCAGAGQAMLRDLAGNTLSYDLVKGQILPLSVVRVMATGTTAVLYGWS